MLTENSIIQSVMATVIERPVAILHDQMGSDEPAIERIKHRAIIDHDSKGNERLLTVASPQYTLVQNRELVAALDMAVDECGADMKPMSAHYHLGHTRMVFQLPGGFKAPGDKSLTYATAILGNDYRGGGSVRFQTGLFRVVCSNGMIVGRTLQTKARRHVGSTVVTEIYEFFQTAIPELQQSAMVAKITAEISAGITVPDEMAAHLIDEMLKDTAKKYHEGLQQTVQNNMNELGSNGWGFAQGISEFQQHTMKAESDSHLAWRDKWIDRVLSEIGVPEKVMAAVR